MELKKKVQTVYLVFAIATELLIGFASAFYLKIHSLSFFLVMVAALIGAGLIEHFILQHDADGME